MVDSAIFWAIALFSVGAALGAVLSRSIINAALCLIVVFLSIAGVFVLNNADFLAIAQVIIYAVGLTIIMLFAIMFTGDRPLPQQRSNPVARIASGIVVLYIFGLLIRAVAGAFPANASLSRTPEFIQTMATQGSTTELGKLLFMTYAMPFEIASILLLAAMIGAIIIAKKRFVETSELETGLRFEIDRESAPSEEAIEAIRASRQIGSPTDQRLSPQMEIGGLEETEPATMVGVGTREGEQ
ncbi:MAG TPA: NADH-quinone oxidoreductase subunit J [Coleofasciculaceae cyanobacterium]|jgi:NADH:ubiquinone oxidoreductase subunit 6 (subunit J)